jgi:hypothetical protein
MIKTYVVVWNNVFDNLESITNQVSNYSIINSDAPEDPSWNNLGMIWYYKQLHFAFKDFIENTNDDIFCWLATDIKSENFKGVFEKAEEILSVPNNALYGPHTTFEAWSESTTSLKKYKNGINYATQTDGAFFFMKRDIVETMLSYMDYLDSKEDLKSMKSGWGMDYIWCALAIYKEKYIFRDTEQIVFHPQGSSYDHSVASAEMETVINIFYEYCDLNNLNSEQLKNIILNITKRMSRDPDYMSLSNFYKNPENINYTIVSISDDRAENKNRIKQILGEKSLINIKPLNASDDEELFSFLDENKNFNLNLEKYKLGEIGCFGSHYKIWQYLASSKIDKILVFEDDAFISDDFIFDVSEALKQLPSKYDLFSVYVDPNQYDRHEEAHIFNDTISKAYQDWSTLCYVITKAGAKKMLKFIKDNGTSHPVDWFIFRNAAKDIFNVYTFNPATGSPMSINDGGNSNIQTTEFFMEYTFKKFLKEHGESQYSQNKQDLFALFIHGKDPGYFVEFGACDGLYLSNTILLEKDYGWTGILSEPAPSYYEQLIKNRDCHLESLCVTDKTGDKVDFLEVDISSDKGLSGLTEFVFQDHHAETRRNNSSSYEVETISLKDMLDKYDAPDHIDFLSIDTEGSEYLILNGYDFSRDFKAIAVEHNGTANREKIYDLLTSKGYQRVLLEFSAWDDWYIKPDLIS